MAVNPATMHEGVSCDGCNATAFTGNRYKCLRCNDYDLCHDCFEHKRFGEQARMGEAPFHEESHPMQLIMTPNDFDLVYAGDPTKNYDHCKIVSFTCPYCNMTGLSHRNFGLHVTTLHLTPPPYNVICPVCIGTPELEHSGNRDTENLRAHWGEFHSGPGETYRSEPPRATNRRPMMARRGQRQIGNRATMAAFPAGFRGNAEEMGFDMAEIIRTFRNADPNEDIQRTMNAIVANNTAQNPAVLLRNAQRFIVNPERQTTGDVPVVGHGVRDSLLLQTIRPLSPIAIYPTDESGRESPMNEFTSAHHKDLEEAVEEDEELRNNPDWIEIKLRLTDNEVNNVLKIMKTNEKKTFNARCDGPPPKMRTIRSGNPAATADADGTQSWLPMVFELPSIKSLGCGPYWNDKRFLRPRKCHREQSVTSTNAEDVEKGEIALAMLRAACVGLPELDIDEKPDKALGKLLRSLNLGEKPSKTADFKESTIESNAADSMQGILPAEPFDINFMESTSLSAIATAPTPEPAPIELVKRHLAMEDVIVEEANEDEDGTSSEATITDADTVEEEDEDDDDDDEEEEEEGQNVEEDEESIISDWSDEW